MICPNPQTCDSAFEWVEERESDIERESARREEELERKKKEMRRVREDEELDAEELKEDIRGFVLPACELFNDARWSLAERSPNVTEVLRLPYPKSSLLPSVTRILQATMSEESRTVLARWEAKMIRELGEEGFRQHKKEVQDCNDEADRLYAKAKTLEDGEDEFAFHDCDLPAEAPCGQPMEIVR